jgi:hypothetical protein
VKTVFLMFRGCKVKFFSQTFSFTCRVTEGLSTFDFAERDLSSDLVYDLSYSGQMGSFESFY